MTDEVAEWMSHLDDETYDRVNAAIDILTEHGPMLGRPLVQAILLIGGDKSGEWTRWYKTNIPLADRVFTKHLTELKP